VISRRTCWHSKGPGGPSDYTFAGGTMSFLNPLDRRTVGLDVFTRLDGLGEAYDHRTGVTLIRDVGEVL